MFFIGNDREYESEAELLEDIKQKAEEEDIRVAIDERATGEKIIKILKDDRDIYLNSIYGEELAESWCGQYDLKKIGTVVILIGIANGEYVKKLQEINKDITIILYEPSYSILYAAIECMGIEEFNRLENIYLLAGDEGLRILYDVVFQKVGYENIYRTYIMSSPNYELICYDEYVRAIELSKEASEGVFIEKNTMEFSGNKTLKNMISNLTDVVCQYGVGDLVNKFQGVDIENVPAVIVAAGPSLDKNMQHLKEAKGKAIIIAADTALRALAAADIIPDIAVMIDPIKSKSVFEDEKIENVPLVCDIQINYEIKQVHHGMRIYQNSPKFLFDDRVSKYGKKRCCLPTAGSVTCDAYSLARVLGFKTIIFVGLDLAYPDNKSHMENAYGLKQDNAIDANEKKYIDVEDIYGKIIKTEANMNIYRKWFEKEVESFPDIKFIDATEGGAKKRGMEILTLKEAIERECRSEKYIDFSEIISSLEPYFNDEERKEMLSYIDNIDSEMEKLRERMNEGIEAYDRLDEFNRKQKYTGKDFKKVMDKISEINDWLSSEEFNYMQFYVSKENYEVKAEIYDDMGNTYEDIKHMIKSGKKMINAMIDATYRVAEDIKLYAR